EVEEKAGVSRRGTDHRQRIRQTRAPAQPWLEIDGFSEREEFACERQDASKLDRGRRCIPVGEFPAGGEPDAALHRCDTETVLEIDDRPRKAGIANRTEVPVIAADHRKRELVAKRPEDVR